MICRHTSPECRDYRSREEKKAETAKQCPQEHDYGYGISIDSETRAGWNSDHDQGSVCFCTDVILVFTSFIYWAVDLQGIATPLVKSKAKPLRILKMGIWFFVLDVEGDDEFSELCRDFEEMRRRLKESAEEKDHSG